MKTLNYKNTLLVTLLLVFTSSQFLGTVPLERKITVPLTFDHYYTYDEVVTALKALNQAFPELTKLEIVGKSEEDRAIYAMTVNNPKTGDSLEKPGIYVDGNIHGNEIQGGEISLYLLNYLLTKYSENEDITRLVDKKCFYVVPMVNVDGRYHFFADANTSSSNRGLRRPHDDDRDGLINEDFPDDLDGDGNICMMRKKDPFGRLKTDPEDPRLMISVKPGEKGEWTLLGMEGIDNDGDGRVNEDAEGYVDPNRNWGFDWMPEYVQSGSGDYPFSGVGLKALAGWIRKHPNICISWAFHNSGGMILRGPSQKNLGEYPRQDIEVYDYLGEQAERILPGYRYMISWKDLYTTYGDAMEWMVGIMGAYGFVGEVFMTSSETFKSLKESNQPSSGSEEDAMAMMRGSNEQELERLKFNDNLAMGELYKPWAAYKHPTYGDIEIGGWTKMSSRLSAPFMLKDMVHRNAMAVIFTAKHTPEVSLEIFETEKINKDLYRIRTRLLNSQAIPTMSYYAQKKKLFPKDMLLVSGNNAKVVAGGTLQDKYRDLVSYKKYRPDVQFLFVPGFGKIEHQFLVSGKGEVTIRYESRFAGSIEKKIKLD